MGGRVREGVPETDPPSPRGSLERPIQGQLSPAPPPASPGLPSRGPGLGMILSLEGSDGQAGRGRGRKLFQAWARTAAPSSPASAVIPAHIPPLTQRKIHPPLLSPLATVPFSPPALSALGPLRASLSLLVQSLFILCPLALPQHGPAPSCHVAGLFADLSTSSQPGPFLVAGLPPQRGANTSALPVPSLALLQAMPKCDGSTAMGSVRCRRP
ncbi:unnamed protein product [Natator depressus]